MANKTTSKILKALGLFTGLESLMIICSVVKMKLVALWLGTVGVGLFGIFNSTIETLTTLTSLSLRQSSVRDIAIENSRRTGLAKIIALVRSWSFAAGLFGAVAAAALAIPLSEWFFDDYSHWWQFCLLGGALLLNAMVNGEKAILQGTGKLRALAKATLWGTLSGLAISIPMFRFMGENSVAWSILVYSLCAMIFLYIMRYRSPEKAHVGIREMRQESGFVKLGAWMALAGFGTAMAQTIFMAWLNRTATTSEVGLYQAGSVILIRYVGLVFSAIAVEYYPRLSANIQSPMRTSLFVSHEIGLLSRLMVPAILAFLLVSKYVVMLLYSSAFVPIIPYINLGILATLLRVTSTCMAYTIPARGDGALYAITETVDAAIGLGLNILCYSLWGLEGLGLAYVLWYFSYTLIITYVYRFHYKLKIYKKTLLTVACGFLITFIAYALATLLWL